MNQTQVHRKRFPQRLGDPLRAFVAASYGFSQALRRQLAEHREFEVRVTLASPDLDWLRRLEEQQRKRRDRMEAAKASEHQEQVAVVQWFDFAYPRLSGRLHAIPNGGARNRGVAGQLKAEGVRPGVPDLCLPVPRHGFHGLYIELKAQGGQLQDSQRDWLEFLSEQGYMAVCCVGADAAMRTIRDYLREAA